MVGCSGVLNTIFVEAWGLKMAALKDTSAKPPVFSCTGETLQLNCGGQAVKPRWMLSKSFVADTAVICQELVSFPDLDTVGDRVMGLDPLGSSWVVKSLPKLPNLSSLWVYVKPQICCLHIQSASNPSNLSGNLSPGSESWGQGHWLRPEDFRPGSRVHQNRLIWEPRTETRSRYWWTHLSPSPDTHTHIYTYIHTYIHTYIYIYIHTHTHEDLAVPFKSLVGGLCLFDHCQLHSERIFPMQVATRGSRTAFSTREKLGLGMHLVCSSLAFDSKEWVWKKDSFS